MPKTVLSLVSICVFDILLRWFIQGDIHQRKVFMIENSRNHSYLQRVVQSALHDEWHIVRPFIPKGSRGTPGPFSENTVFTITQFLLDSTGWTQYGHTIRLWCTFTVCEIICQFIYWTIFSKNSMLCSNVLVDIFSKY